MKRKSEVSLANSSESVVVKADKTDFPFGYTGTSCKTCGMAQFYTLDGAVISCSHEHHLDSKTNKPMSKDDYNALVEKFSTNKLPIKSGDRSLLDEVKEEIKKEEIQMPQSQPVMVSESKPNSSYDAIIETIFRIDPEAIHTRLMGDSKLPVDAHSADYGVLADALDRCMDNSRDAFLLYINAKVALTKLESDLEVQSSDMRRQATQILDAQKQSGARTKQVTDADVVAKMAALFPDEFRLYEEKKTKMKAAVAYFENLAALSKERAKDVRALVEVIRR